MDRSHFSRFGGSVYARLVSITQGWFLRHFSEHPYIVATAAPFLFLFATVLVRKFAPDAKGSGIPQVLEAIEAGKNPTHAEQAWRSPLVSIRTAVIKVLSSFVGILGGASIGREGPTVQIAASLFSSVGRVVRRYAPDVELPSYPTAGAAAGVAAAFNAPLAGIT